MQVSEAITSRSSCRAFLDQPVPRETMEQLMALACSAPSAINLQPWQFTVVMNGEVRRLAKKLLKAHSERAVSCAPDNVAPLPQVYLERQKELSRLMGPLMAHAGLDKDFIDQGSLSFYGAPAVVMATLDSVFPPERSLDIGFALGWLLLAAADLGLASCPIGLICAHEGLIKDFLNIDPSRRLVLAVAVGHGDPEAVINRMVSPRTPLSEVVRWY